MNRKLVLALVLTLLIGMLNVAFNVQRAKASETIYIRTDGSIDPPTPLISTIDYVTYTFTGNINDRIVVERDNVIVDGVGYTLQGPDIGAGGGIGIDLSGRSNVTIKNMTIKAFNYGIWLHESSNYNSIVGNNITARNEYGIYLRESSNNIIWGNSITDNRLGGIYLHRYSSYNSISGNNISNYGGGVLLTESSNNSVSGNNIINNQYREGVFLEKSFNNSISYNNISNNYLGVYLWCSEYNNLVKNNITENNKYGISLYASSNNLIEQNDITHNEVGIYFQGMWANEHNSFYHNNFIANSQQVYIEVYGYANVWDDGYPSGGNYWSNYTGIDLFNGPNQNETGSDGVGDINYVIDENNRDLYPLMSLFAACDAGTWNEEKYNINVVSNSTVSKFRVNKTERIISFNVTGEAGLGFCRVTIPNVIVQDLWQGNYSVLINGQPTEFRNWTDDTNTYIYFTYQHSEHEVTIIPEFHTWTSMLLILIILTVAISINKRRLLKIP